MLSNFSLVFLFVESSSIDELDFFHEDDRFFDANKVDENLLHSKNFKSRLVFLSIS